ncbi:MAG TPA: ABC transporter transmembrane domain-containing protein, partial [Burkholderiales bacterium]|nr:ABC transporter transmembrane domain-containing protein [Burkholderiales bacterium]
MDRGTEAGEAEIAAEGFVWLLASLHSLARLPFDPALFLSRFPPPYDRVVLLQALRTSGFRVGEIASGTASLRSWAIAFRRAASGALVPLLVVKSDRERILYFEAGSNDPHTVPVAEFEALCEPVLLAVSQPEPGDDSVDGFEDEPSEFGFRWFVPEILKHKDIWRDVLIASAAIMVVGLATPLFTQVVVDKVVVHQTTSTLLVIGSALGVFLVFNAAMTWMRQYLVIHTGNRVDAVLATSVLGHLLRLPMPYFERRPTGVTVARLHGVETIRDFITGAAVSFVLDLPFLV